MSLLKESLDMRGRIFNFQRYSIHDGPGIRSCIFFFGCHLRCLWCCNPESFSPNSLWTREVTVSDVMDEILEDEPYFKNSGGGITLSGGEPMLQIEFAKSLLKECKRRNIGTAVETCGDVPWDNFEMLEGLVDHYLYDIKHLDSDAHRRCTGVDNRRILDNLKRLKQTRDKKIYLRVPLIPEYNMTEEEALKIGQLSNEVSALEVHLLPYHRLGEKKYSQLNISYAMAGKRDPMSYDEGRQSVDNFANIVRRYIENLYIGG